MSKARVLVLRAPGTNCDVEAMFAFQQAGAEASRIHINRLISGEEQLANYQVMVIPGGFTYGDDITAGRILANEIKLKLGDSVQRFIESGGLILGICNGFQILVKAGLLPEPTSQLPQLMTLETNDSNKFECRWVHLGVNKDINCVFMEGIDSMYLPVAHAEGKVITDTENLPRLKAVLHYTDEQGNDKAAYPYNPNGSVDNIAGICDSSGRVFGLMPHPERHIRGTQHPQWTRFGAKERGDGFQIFLNAVKWAENL